MFDQKATDFDHDVVKDFDTNNDKLDLTATKIDSWDAFKDAAHQIGTSVFVDTGLGHIELQNTQLNDIGEEDVVV